MIDLPSDTCSRPTEAISSDRSKSRRLAKDGTDGGGTARLEGFLRKLFDQ